MMNSSNWKFILLLITWSRKIPHYSMSSTKVFVWEPFPFSHNICPWWWNEDFELFTGFLKLDQPQWNLTSVEKYSKKNWNKFNKFHNLRKIRRQIKLSPLYNAVEEVYCCFRKLKIILKIICIKILLGIDVYRFEERRVREWGVGSDGWLGDGCEVWTQFSYAIEKSRSERRQQGAKQISKDGPNCPSALTNMMLYRVTLKKLNKYSITKNDM